MCVYSMVIDHYTPQFPQINPGANPQDWSWLQSGPWTNAAGMREQIDELKTLIAEFKEALEAAKKVDALTNQPDCEDPEKAKLVDRVAELERRLDQFEKPGKRVNRPRFKSR